MHLLIQKSNASNSLKIQQPPLYLLCTLSCSLSLRTHTLLISMQHSKQALADPRLCSLL